MTNLEKQTPAKVGLEVPDDVMENLLKVTRGISDMANIVDIDDPFKPKSPHQTIFPNHTSRVEWATTTLNDAAMDILPYLSVRLFLVERLSFSCFKLKYHLVLFQVKPG